MDIVSAQTTWWQKAQDVGKALFFPPQRDASQMESANLEKKIANSEYLEKQSPDFQADLENKRQEFELARLKTEYLRELNRQKLPAKQTQLNQQFQEQFTQYIDKCEEARLDKPIPFENFLAEQRRLAELELQRRNHELTFLMAFVQVNIYRNLEDYKRILNNYPWRLDPVVILEEYNKYRSGNDKIPPFIIISPPKIPENLFSHPPVGLPRLENTIEENLRLFLNQNYGKYSSTRPTDLAAGAWDTNKMRSETAVKLLFYLLKSIPVIILDSEIDGDKLNFSIASWDVGTEYVYQPIISSFSYKDFLYQVAKESAQQWEKQKQEILAKGIPLETLLKNPQAQENEINLAIWHQEQTLKECGLEESADYQPTKAGVEKLSQYLSILHCLCASLATDAYYFTRYGETPKLPHFLRELTQGLNPQEAQGLIEVAIDYYQSFCQQLEAVNSDKSPEIFLELALGLLAFDDKSLPQQQLEKSLNTFLQIRKLDLGLSLFDLLAKVEQAIEIEDRTYVDKVNQCLRGLNVSREIRLGEAYYKQGVKCYDAKDYEGAIFNFELALLGGYALAEIKLARSQAALKVSGNQEIKRQKQAENMENQGELYFESGDYERALFFYEQAVNFGSTTAEVKVAQIQHKKQQDMAQSYEKQGDASVAATEYLQAIIFYEQAVNFGSITAETKLAKAKIKVEETQDLDLGNGIVLKLVEIPSGSFKMQGDHEIYLKGFLMGTYSVTQKQYQQIMGTNPSSFQGDNHPVERVTWYDAVEFCQRLSEKTGRHIMLPSEAQWEYAAGAGTSQPVFFGEEEHISHYAWFDKISLATTHPVGEKKPNPWGLYDILGNVWQWCQDDWETDYHLLPNDGSVFKKNANTRARRGGSWLNYARYCHCHFRLWYNPDHKHNSIGFRVVVDLNNS